MDGSVCKEVAKWNVFHTSSSSRHAGTCKTKETQKTNYNKQNTDLSQTTWQRTRGPEWHRLRHRLLTCHYAVLVGALPVNKSTLSLASPVSCNYPWVLFGRWQCFMLRLNQRQLSLIKSPWITGATASNVGELGLNLGQRPVTNSGGTNGGPGQILEYLHTSLCVWGHRGVGGSMFTVLLAGWKVRGHLDLRWRQGIHLQQATTHTKKDFRENPREHIVVLILARLELPNTWQAATGERERQRAKQPGVWGSGRTQPLWGWTRATGLQGQIDINTTLANACTSLSMVNQSVVFPSNAPPFGKK